MRFLVLVALAGCAAQTYWVKPGATQTDLDADIGYCRAQAFSVPGMNMMQATIVQDQCLRGRGWNRVRE